MTRRVIPVPRRFHRRGARPPPTNPGAQSRRNGQNFLRLVLTSHQPSGRLFSHEAICREAREEAGIELGPDDLSFAQVVHRADRGQRVSFFFAALRWRGEPRNLSRIRPTTSAGSRSIACRTTWCPTCVPRSSAGARARSTASRAGSRGGGSVKPTPGLGVVTKQVVHGEPGDWGLAGEGGMRPVHVVDVQPARQGGGPLP